MIAESLVVAALSAHLGQSLEFLPIAGHHFNVDAPQKCDGVPPAMLTARSVRCVMSRSGKVPILLSVCDDAKTFCRQETFDVTVAGKIGAVAPTLSAPKSTRGAPEGFIDNDPAFAFARAAKEGKSVLIDFYGIWCPPCNQLEEESYPDPAFQAAAANYVLLGIDVDAASSFELKARYKVGGYPTLLVSAADGREINRVVGYRSGPSLARFLRAPAPKPKTRLDELIALREKDAVGAARLLVREFPQEAAFIDWATDLADPSLRGAVDQIITFWWSSPALGETEYTRGDLLSSQASYLEKIGDAAAAKTAWSRAADAYLDEARLSHLKVPRAANFGRGEALMNAGRKDEAKVLYRSLAAAYPEEFTFNYDFARALKDDGAFSAAWPYAVKAASAGYGDNWLRAMRLRAEIENSLGRKPAALKTLDEALAQPQDPGAAAVRTTRYVAALRDLREKLRAQK